MQKTDGKGRSWLVFFYNFILRVPLTQKAFSPAWVLYFFLEHVFVDKGFRFDLPDKFLTFLSHFCLIFCLLLALPIQLWPFCHTSRSYFLNPAFIWCQWKSTNGHPTICSLKLHCIPTICTNSQLINLDGFSRNYLTCMIPNWKGHSAILRLIFPHGWRHFSPQTNCMFLKWKRHGVSQELITCTQGCYQSLLRWSRRKKLFAIHVWFLPLMVIVYFRKLDGSCSVTLQFISLWPFCRSPSIIWSENNTVIYWKRLIHVYFPMQDSIRKTK